MKPARFTKKTINIIIAALVCAILVGMGGVYAVERVARNNSISAEAAENFAFADACVKPQDAAVTKNKFDFEDGMFVYEIEFVADGMFYDYTIRAADGTVLKSEAEAVQGYRAEAISGSTEDPFDRAKISEQQALEKVLADAGLAAAAVTVTKQERDSENGMPVFEIGFYCSEGEEQYAEYDYTVNAITGEVLGKRRETLQYVAALTDDSQEQTAPETGATQTQQQTEQQKQQPSQTQQQTQTQQQ
ncbi:MAG: PepSY domain-containing protein, partial [Lachnospiraceae bacterium]|nr:PepSY domain-containing protein [Lachnospiraceae bacterium]